MTGLLEAYWPHLCLLVMMALIWVLEIFFPKAVQRVEENIIITIITSILLVSLGQIIARDGFESGWSAALEFQMFAFSWLIILGMSFGIKYRLHLGIDIITKAVSRPVARAFGFFGALCGLFYGLILLDSTWLNAMGVDVKSGAIDYWVTFYEKSRIGVDELRYPEFIQSWFGVGERVQKWVVLLVVPIGLALLSLRSLQACVDILLGKCDGIISGHEAEDLVKSHGVEPEDHVSLDKKV